jgi:hypothetical protein
MPKSEGFHLKTHSDMKQLLEDTKWMVLQDKMKKCTLFKFRVDMRAQLSRGVEDRSKRAGLGDVRRPRVEYTDYMCWYTWSNTVTTDRQYHDWLRSRRARRRDHMGDITLSNKETMPPALKTVPSSSLSVGETV